MQNNLALHKMDGVVRTASIEDIKPLARLFDSYRVWYNKKTDLNGAECFLSERLENKDSEIFVYDKEGMLLGFVQLYPLFSSTRMKRLWLLNDLYVDENHRGKGISLQLIEKSKQLVRDTDACAMFLETDKTNQIGNKLYPRSGFKLNEISNYYEWSSR